MGNAVRYLTIALVVAMVVWVLYMVLVVSAAEARTLPMTTVPSHGHAPAAYCGPRCGPGRVCRGRHTPRVCRYRERSLRWPWPRPKWAPTNRRWS